MTGRRAASFFVVFAKGPYVRMDLLASAAYKGVFVFPFSNVVMPVCPQECVLSCMPLNSKAVFVTLL